MHQTTDKGLEKLLPQKEIYAVRGLICDIVGLAINSALYI